jgi:hypothetical protein
MWFLLIYDEESKREGDISMQLIISTKEGSVFNLLKITIKFRELECNFFCDIFIKNEREDRKHCVPH